MSVHLLGIRHHGPGSARSLLGALTQIAPDVILVEGPADAESLLPLASHEDMAPPVAMLLYEVDAPSNALFFPFASFSPEWNAIRFGLHTGTPIRLIDLPAATTLALEDEPKPTEPDDSLPLLLREDTDPDRIERMKAWRADPLLALAQAAGYDDSERFWERLVEERQDGAPVFEAVAEAMSALRHEADKDRTAEDRRESMREAHMRQVIRGALRDGFERIAVVCGAWHVPALQEIPPESRDRPWLARLPRKKIATTWIPWSHGRLAYASGYGAGVHAPGWYHHLFTQHEHVGVGWLHRIALLLRERGMDASPAQVIDASRLAETLAALRSRPAVGLHELHDAARSVMLGGDSVPWGPVRDELVLGERIGHVPQETPMVPLQRDLTALQRRLRLRPGDGDRDIVLDLRRDLDRERSWLLRRLRILDVPWGEGGDRGEGKGTFKEEWTLAWDPEFEVRIIEASPHGATVETAASTIALQQAEQAQSLPALTELAQEVVFAELPGAMPGVVACLQREAAMASDLTQVMRALPPLVHLVRYGDVRGTQAAPVESLVSGMIARVCAGIPTASRALREDAAEPVVQGMTAMHTAVMLMDDPSALETWSDALVQVTDDPRGTPLLRGKSCRLALDAGRFEEADATDRLSLHMSRASDPSQTAAWLDGFLRGSGQVLVYDDGLWTLVDDWLGGLREEDFEGLLPMLRRTFSSFSEPERRGMGERARATSRQGGQHVTGELSFDAGRMAQVEPVLRLILGLEDG
jgi:hypothetical protein